jgi:hypothetical protein
MTHGDDHAGFLSRWSRRKVLVRQGGVTPEPTVPAERTDPAATAASAAVTHGIDGAAAAGSASESAVDAVAAEPNAADKPPPTLADAQQLTRESDYSRFVARGVDSDVKNAALKQLFTDPHFNVMDGLDTYIDDYGKPDPLPAGMLRQMAQARSLGLFTDDEDPAGEPVAAATPLDAPDAPATPPATLPPPRENASDEDSDLRLQPYDAAGRPGPAPGAGQDGTREH